MGWTWPPRWRQAKKKKNRVPDQSGQRGADRQRWRVPWEHPPRRPRRRPPAKKPLPLSAEYQGWGRGGGKERGHQAAGRDNDAATWSSHAAAAALRRPRRGAPRPAVPRAVTSTQAEPSPHPPSRHATCCTRGVACRRRFRTRATTAPQRAPIPVAAHVHTPSRHLPTERPRAPPAPLVPPIYYELVPWLKRCPPPSAAPPLSSCLQWTGQWRSRRRPARRPPL